MVATIDLISSYLRKITCCMLCVLAICESFLCDTGKTSLDAKSRKTFCGIIATGKVMVGGHHGEFCDRKMNSTPARLARDAWRPVCRPNCRRAPMPRHNDREAVVAYLCCLFLLPSSSRFLPYSTHHASHSPSIYGPRQGQDDTNQAAELGRYWLFLHYAEERCEDTRQDCSRQV